MLSLAKSDRKCRLSLSALVIMELDRRTPIGGAAGSNEFSRLELSGLGATPDSLGTCVPSAHVQA